MGEDFLNAALAFLQNEVARLQLLNQQLRDENKRIQRMYQEENTRLKHEIKNLINLYNQ
jgi:hypothetical protein